MSSKLNKIAGMYNATRALSDKGKGSGSPEEMIKAVDESIETERKAKKRSKKLEFSDEEGMTTDK